MKFFIRISAIIMLATAFAPVFAFAAAQKAAPFSYAAWLPYWKKTAGANEISLYLEKFKEISPFSYEVRADGTHRRPENKRRFLARVALGRQ
jgi:hypothetical protein